MAEKILAKKGTYGGLFFIAMGTLLYEVLLTRIFSVTMWYHFAFMAISIAMFGMTVGSIIVYILPNFFNRTRVIEHLSLSSFLFALTIIISFLIHINIPFNSENTTFYGIFIIIITYIIIAIPFIFSGICVCLALTKFPEQISKMYASDLIGAALGCILFIYILKITDAPTAVIINALIINTGTICFLTGQKSKKFMKIAIICNVLLLSFSIIHTILVKEGYPVIRLKWVKNKYQTCAYEKWNTFSRIAVWQSPENQIIGWGLSDKYPVNKKPQELYIDIDAGAGTFMTNFDGNLTKVDILKYDITNLVHYLKSDAKVLIIGTGGGRDILSALLFNQKSIYGVEFNKDIIDIVNKDFGDFTGHLDKNPKVTFVNDEARSYIARTGVTFDIIQASLVDTAAATAAGAFVLTENSLYTVEAWEIFLKKLNQDGILTMSRWYYKNNPSQMYRLTSLAVASLVNSGIKHPRNNIIIAKKMIKNYEFGVGTILVSKKPFSNKDINTIKGVCNNMGFDIVLTPDFSINDTFATIASNKNTDEFFDKYPLNITPPTDDSPFFFHMLRLKDSFTPDLWKEEVESFNLKAVVILVTLMIIVVVLTFCFIIIPLILTTKKSSLKGSFPFFIFFASIGLGFMFIEISQMQRFIIFLGHPVYSLSVVLFSFLISSGIGSLLTQKIKNYGKNTTIITLSLLLFVLIIFGLLTPYIIKYFQSSPNNIRIFLTSVTLLPLGLFMGTAFPVGMSLAMKRSENLTPWLWGINGAMSVCASVFSVAIALSFTISASYWTGFICYIFAFLSFFWLNQTQLKEKPGSSN